MKRILLSTIALLSINLSSAQAGFQLWGLTSQGTNNNSGVIFSTDGAGNNFNVRHLFTPAEGRLPTGSLALYNGKLYGIARLGGSNNGGIIFEVDPASAVFTKKFDFPQNAGQTGSLVLSGNKFYGLTRSTIFEWNPVTNTYITRYSFNNSAIVPNSLTELNGKLYGTANGNDITEQFGGVIFEWNPATNAYATKVNFTGVNGMGPTGLSLYNGKFYGTTFYGGSGYVPQSDSRFGVLFEWDPTTNVYTKKLDFNGTNGGSPLGKMTLNGSAFYGLTASGGSNNAGVIFQWNPVTNSYIKKIDFALNGSCCPTGDLTLSASKFYGITSGAIFEWDPVTNIYKKKKGFGDEDGSGFGSLLLVPGSNTWCKAPVISNVKLSTTILSPVNNYLKTVGVGYKTNGHCNCGPVTSWLTVKFNEDETLPGTPDNYNSTEWKITDEHHVKLRASVLGFQPYGRVYTITINTQNTLGGISRYSVDVTVPLSSITMSAKNGRAANEPELADEVPLTCNITPNPTSQNFNLQLRSSSTKKIDVNIFDMSGRKIARLNPSKNQTTLFGENLRPGVYMVSVIQGEQRQVIKVIKQ
jgi:Secretion system C-terminal sorting domain